MKSIFGLNWKTVRLYLPYGNLRLKHSNLSYFDVHFSFTLRLILVE